MSLTPRATKLIFGMAKRIIPAELLRLPVLANFGDPRGGHSVASVEPAAEGRKTRKPNVQGDIRPRRTGLQQPSGAFQTQPRQIRMRSLPEHPLKRAKKMILRDTGFQRKLFQRNLPVQIAVKVFARDLQAPE